MAEAVASKDVQGSAVLEQVDMERVFRRGLAGTYVAAILGLSPLEDPHDVWLDKLIRAQRAASSWCTAWAWGTQSR